MRRVALLLLTVLASAWAQAEGPPLALRGLPLELRCGIDLPRDSAILRPQERLDGADLGEAAAREPSRWPRRPACDAVRTVLLGAGAHIVPDAAPPPGWLRVDIRLDAAWLDSTRVVEQRVGGELSPIAVPHWTLGLDWTAAARICAPGRCHPLWSGSLQGGADSGDYEPLSFDELLAEASREATRDLPRRLANLGPWAEILATPAAPEPPAELLPVRAAWPLVTDRDAERRHDGVAFVLGSPLLPLPTRRAVATSVLLGGGSSELGRDVLAWWMKQEAPADTETPLRDESLVLVRWLALRDPAPATRGAAVGWLAGRPGDEVRAILLAAVADPDLEVADRALSTLRPVGLTLPLDAQPLATPPAVPPSPSWASDLWRRGGASTDEQRWAAALQVGGPAAQLWMFRSLADGHLPADPRPVLQHPDLRLRSAAALALSSGAQAEASLLLLALEQPLEAPSHAALLRTLASRNPAAAQPAALLAAVSPDPVIRVAAVETLDPTGGPEPRAALEGLRKDPDPQVRRAARKRKLPRR
jgi:hypothetical protein